MILLECEYWEFNDQQQKLYDLDNKNNFILEDGNLKKATFYTVNNISPYQGKYCLLDSGGTNYAINESYASVKKRIEKNLFFIYN
jgi:hypothetical protein